MIIWISGGSGSGKSKYAEDFIQKIANTQLYYIATMEVWDSEGAERVQRHKSMRKEKDFHTLECPLVENLPNNITGAVLLEDLTNLFMNEFYKNRECNPVEKIETALLKLAERCKVLVIVSNQITADGKEHSPEMEDFLLKLVQLEEKLMEKSAEVYEIVAGIPIRCHRKKEKEARTMTFIIGGKYQGKRKYAKKLAKSPTTHIVNVMDFIDKQSTVEEILEKLQQKREFSSKIIYICDEVGSGIVPLEKSEREWREKVGRISQYLANESSLVIRMISGIPIILKESQDIFS